MKVLLCGCPTQLVKDAGEHQVGCRVESAVLVLLHQLESTETTTSRWSRTGPNAIASQFTPVGVIVKPDSRELMYIDTWSTPDYPRTVVTRVPGHMDVEMVALMARTIRDAIIARERARQAEMDAGQSR